MCDMQYIMRERLSLCVCMVVLFGLCLFYGAISVEIKEGNHPLTRYKQTNPRGGTKFEMYMHVGRYLFSLQCKQPSAQI